MATTRYTPKDSDVDRLRRELERYKKERGHMVNELDSLRALISQTLFDIDGVYGYDDVEHEALERLRDRLKKETLG